MKVDARGNAYVGGSTRSTGFPTTPGAFDTTHERRRVRRALRPVRDQAQPRRLRRSSTRRSSAAPTATSGATSTSTAAGTPTSSAATLSPDFPKLNAAGSALRATRRAGRGRRARSLADGRRRRLGRRRGRTGRPRDSRRLRPVLQRRRRRCVRRQARTRPARVDFASFLGGSESEAANDVALDPAGDVYLTGHTYSPDFTTTPGAFDRTWAGDPLIFWGDAFVAKVDVDATAPPVPPPGARAGRARAGVARRGRGGRVAGDVRLERRERRRLLHDPGRRDLGVRRAADPQRDARPPRRSRPRSLPDGNWFWRVRGVNSEGTPGAWSEVAHDHRRSRPRRRLRRPRRAPRRWSSPADGASVSQPFTFDWSDVANAAWYVIEADDTSSFTSLVWAATTTPSLARDQLAPERDDASGACGRSTPTAWPGPTRRSARSSSGRTAGPLAGADAHRPEQRRALLTRAVDHVRLERRRGRRRLHDPDRRLATRSPRR